MFQLFPAVLRGNIRVRDAFRGSAKVPMIPGQRRFRAIAPARYAGQTIHVSRWGPLMPRRPRFDITDIPQHVIQRGNNRQPCFLAESDYRRYLDFLSDACETHGCNLHAYVLMTNHVHLLVTPTRLRALGKMMQSLGRRYVKRFNKIHQRTGTLWEGRYKASLVSSDEYLLTCYRYIELNPVRAGIVSKPQDYRWSSYRHNALGLFDSLIVEHETYLSLGAEGRARHGNYRNLFASEIGENTLSDIRNCANGDLVFGNESFKDQIELVLDRKSRIGKAGRPRKSRIGL